ncbi:hypothetical protein PINS_up022088 [Pythium insidiosum]|nr:hypothetical protein PINS_up022088 [Pythium insidiosum]
MSSSVSTTPEASKSLSNVTTNSLQSRVLNAFEECGSFAAHPVVHTKALDQLVRYVTMSSQKDGLVFFTRHALISLAKLYASVSTEARRERFSAVLQSTQTFLQLGEQRDRAASPPPSTAAQKAVAQQWKHALRVLLVLISHGLAAVRLAEHNSWRQLLDTITLFLAPSSGSLPSFVDGEEDEALVLSVLECLVDSVIALFSGQSRAQLRSESEAECTSFNDALMGLLCSGVDATQHCKPLVKCCVRQTGDARPPARRRSTRASGSLVSRPVLQRRTPSACSTRGQSSGGPRHRCHLGSCGSSTGNGRRVCLDRSRPRRDPAEQCVGSRSQHAQCARDVCVAVRMHHIGRTHRSVD